jgi:hypothetical protein
MYTRTTTPEAECGLDWTIMDQIAVAALITGDDALAKVLLAVTISALPLGLY